MHSIFIQPLKSIKYKVDGEQEKPTASAGDDEPDDLVDLPVLGVARGVTGTTVVTCWLFSANWSTC